VLRHPHRTSCQSSNCGRMRTSPPQRNPHDFTVHRTGLRTPTPGSRLFQGMAAVSHDLIEKFVSANRNPPSTRRHHLTRRFCRKNAARPRSPLFEWHLCRARLRFSGFYVGLSHIGGKRVRRTHVGEFSLRLAIFQRLRETLLRGYAEKIIVDGCGLPSNPFLHPISLGHGRMP